MVAKVLLRGPGVSDDTHALPGQWVRIVHPTRAPVVRAVLHLVPLRVSDRRVGGLLLVGTPDAFDASEDRLVSAAAAQIRLAHVHAGECVSPG